MNKFFSEINQYLNIKDWVDILDWIFNEKNIFLGWSRNHVGKFTKKIKRLDGINQSNFMCLASRDLKFPSRRSSKRIEMLIGKGSSEARDLLRHIRNGIAHGNATVFCRDGEYYFEIIDFNLNRDLHTAYILFPVDYLMSIYNIYWSIQKEI